MGNFMGGDENAKNAASQAIKQNAQISSEIALDSEMVCGNTNEVNIQSNCNIIDSVINQKGQCTMKNDATQDVSIKNSISQTSKQGLSQTAKAEGQNFSLNFGNVNASNVGSQSISGNASISNKIGTTCLSNAANHNLVNCKGGNLIHSTINQTEATNIMQDCVQKAALNSSILQNFSQAMTQKATAIKKDALAAILFAAAALILSIGISTKLGAGKVIRYILIFFCAFFIIALVSAFSWNIISSKEFHKPFGVERQNVSGDYCPDTSLMTHNRHPFNPDPGAMSNQNYYKDAVHCIAVGGVWFNEDGNQTDGYSKERWPGPGPAPFFPGKGWNPKLATDGGSNSIRWNLKPQCLPDNNISYMYPDAANPQKQCWAINSGMMSDLRRSQNSNGHYPTLTKDTGDPSLYFNSTENAFGFKGAPTGKNGDDGSSLYRRDYDFWKDTCHANKCSWVPQAEGLETDDGSLPTVPTSSGPGIHINKLLKTFSVYDYPVSKIDHTGFAVFNSPMHKQLALPSGTKDIDIFNKSMVDYPNVYVNTLYPLAQRFDMNKTIIKGPASTLKAINYGTPLSLKDMVAGFSLISPPYATLPFCTGHRPTQSLTTDQSQGDAGENDPRFGKICGQDLVDKQISAKNKK